MIPMPSVIALSDRFLMFFTFSVSFAALILVSSYGGVAEAESVPQESHERKYEVNLGYGNPRLRADNAGGSETLPKLRDEHHLGIEGLYRHSINSRWSLVSGGRLLHRSYSLSQLLGGSRLASFSVRSLWFAVPVGLERRVLPGRSWFVRGQLVPQYRLRENQELTFCQAFCVNQSLTAQLLVSAEIETYFVFQKDLLLGLRLSETLTSFYQRIGPRAKLGEALIYFGYQF